MTDGWRDEDRRVTARLNILRMRNRLDTTPHLHSNLVAGCYRCELTRTGEAMKGINQGGRCTCGGCGRVFAGLTAFDAHFRALSAAPWSECRDPATDGAS